jgi:hypothetical protein
MTFSPGDRVCYKPGGQEPDYSDMGTIVQARKCLAVQWDRSESDGIDEDVIEDDGRMPQFCDKPLDCGDGCESCPRVVKL